MKASRDVLEDRLKAQQEELNGLRSYVTELKAMTAKHGTGAELVEQDLREAEHNIAYYEARVTMLKSEIDASESGKPTQTEGTPAPQGSRRGINSVVFSSLGFIAGALFGSRIKSRKDK